MPPGDLTCFYTAELCCRCHLNQTFSVRNLLLPDRWSDQRLMILTGKRATARHSRGPFDL